MLVRTCLRPAVLLAVVAFTAVALPVHADDETEKPRKGLSVTVDDNDVVAAEEAEAAASVEEAEPAPKKTKRNKRKQQLEDAPGEDASEAEIDAYLRELNSDVRDTGADLKAAKRGGDDPDEILRLETELRDKKDLLRDEKDRLTTTEPGLVAGGAVLTALGGIALVSSLVLLIAWPLTGVDGHFDDEYGWGSLGCLLGGTAGLAAGIPMIVAGARRTPRGSGGGEPYYDEARFSPLPAGPRIGFSVTLPF